MNKDFIKRLDKFLDSECDDYGMKYDYSWIDDCGYCEVEIKRDHSDLKACLNIKYDKENDDLLVELGEGSWYEMAEFDWTVKYFWMIVSPQIFPE